MKRIDLSIDRRDAINLGFLAGLLLLGLVGFESSYGGLRFMIPAVGGLIAGLVIGYVSVYRSWPGIMVLAVGLVAFLLLGGPLALPETTIAGIIPTITTIRELGQGATSGWMDLVTTAPPVGTLPPLLVIPFFTGLLSGTVGAIVTLRTIKPLLSLIVPVLVLATGILVGTQTPVSVLLQGSVFGAVSIAWLSWRTRSAVNTTQVTSGSGFLAFRGTLMTIAVLVFAALVALPIGKFMPFAEANSRFTIRELVEPPLDPKAFASPLGSARKYSTELKDSELFSVRGLPSGARMRIASMDSYDGIVWGVAGGKSTAEAGESGTFERVGTEISTSATGDEANVRVAVVDYSDVWVPDAGQLTGIEFEGPNAKELQAEFRYNPATGDGAVPSKLVKGDIVDMSVVLPTVPSPEEAAELAATQGVFPEALSVKAVAELQSDLLSADAASGLETPYSKAQYLTDTLRASGYYSNGDAAASRPPSLTGHGAYRLSKFADSEMLIGDEEQYAATAALLTSYSGIPTRVVMGAVKPTDAPSDWIVTGKDLTTWIEVGLDGAWVPLDVIPDKNKLVPTQEPLKQRPKLQPQQVLPPPPPDAVEAITPEDQNAGDEDKDKSPFKLPWFVVTLLKFVVLPLLIVAAIVGAMAGAKAWRRKRRRTLGPPAKRISGGWQEVTSTAIDYGTELPERATRKEGAQVIPARSATALATRADEAVFGPSDPTDVEAAEFWSAVGSIRQDIGKDKTRWEKLKAVMSFRSWRAR